MSVKPVLQCKTETFITVDVHELERFITEVTGHEYEILPNEEWSNNQYQKVWVSDTLDESDKEVWETFKTTGKIASYRISLILSGLCAEGHMVAGTYLVKVWW